mmetsp:Transcript_46027/g.127838  ORF Transcript_46027/g.127838 Transcript_46027/m.127838 type:complete len:204 (-) Transcript_46027:394-1005(-)
MGHRPSIWKRLAHPMHVRCPQGLNTASTGLLIQILQSENLEPFLKETLSSVLLSQEVFRDASNLCSSVARSRRSLRPNLLFDSACSNFLANDHHGTGAAAFFKIFRQHFCKYALSGSATAFCEFLSQLAALESSMLLSASSPRIAGSAMLPCAALMGLRAAAGDGKHCCANLANWSAVFWLVQYSTNLVYLSLLACCSTRKRA